MRKLARYRPYIVAVAAVLIVAVLPGNGPDRRAEQVGAGAGGPIASDPSAPLGDPAARDATAPTVQTDGTPVGAPAAQTATAAGPLPTARPSATVTTVAGSATKAAAAVSPSQYPGIGTDAALKNPNCDPSTGRIRFPNPYAPRCVAPWPKGADNGGATTSGVDATNIRVAVLLSGGGTPQQEEQARQDFREVFDIFNKHYELWGRQVQLHFVTSTGTSEVAQRADAIKVATSIKPFMSTTHAASYQVYSGELAARGIITLDIPVSWKATQDQAPYRWGAYQDERATIMHITEYAGRRLAGKPARWAGDATLNGRPRQFGVIYPDVWEKAVLDNEAARNGLPLVDSLSYKEDDTVGAQERARVVIARMKDRGVTSVIAGTGFLFNIVLTKEATSQLYFPEWIVTGWNNQDATIFARLYDQQQWQHAFGIGPISALPPAEKNWISANYRWHFGREPPAGEVGTISSAHTIAFQSFIGLQGAGPNLNPARFRDAMFTFPPSGGVWCKCVGTFGVSFGRRIAAFTWDDYTGWDDVAEKWWDPTYRTKDEVGLEGVGAYMKVEGGRRYLPGEWPRADPRVFDPNGAIEHVDDWPPGESPPPYEHHADS